MFWSIRNMQEQVKSCVTLISSLRSSLTCICVKELCPFRLLISSIPSSKSELLPSKSCGLLSDSSSAKKISDEKLIIVEITAAAGKQKNFAFLITRKFKWIVYHLRLVLSAGDSQERMRSARCRLTFEWYSREALSAIDAHKGSHRSKSRKITEANDLRRQKRWNEKIKATAQKKSLLVLFSTKWIRVNVIFCFASKDNVRWKADEKMCEAHVCSALLAMWCDTVQLRSLTSLRLH